MSTAGHSRKRSPTQSHDADPPGTAARRGALRLLTNVIQQGRSLDGSLESALKGIERGDDRALARSLASGVLRWLTDLDALIDSATPRPLPNDARARMALRIGLAGHLLLGTPPHAMVATTLALTEGGPRRLTHAVLSRLLREGAALPELPTLPAPFGMRWTADWGGDVAAAAARGFASEPATDLTLRDAAETAHWTAELGGMSLAPGHIRIPRQGPLIELPGFGEGAWWVQDLAASLPARLLRAQPGERVLDLCAAPGGKTLQLAATGATVTALDQSDTRLDRVRDNLARTGLRATVIAVDALDWTTAERFDAVLLDAPCSATGVFRRHPDVLHLKGSRDLTPVLALQSALLDRALAMLAPGGRLVYATCSLDPREGEAQLAALQARTPQLRIDPVCADELPPGLASSPYGWVRTLPGQLAAHGGLDGFFIVRLRND